MIGEALVGIGVLALFAVFAHWFYQITRTTKTEADIMIARDKIYLAAIEKYAKKKGIDLKVEELKDKLFSNNKTFRNQLIEEIKQDFFGKTGGKDEKK